MSTDSAQLVLPRPGQPFKVPVETVPAPSEAVFTETFGALLPPAKYLSTSNGKAAFYEILPAADTPPASVKRVVFVHGVQTPALGLNPIARALHAEFPHSHFVLLDQWGHGLTETPIVPHEPALFHALLDSLLEHLRWASAHFVSYSFGASTTASYAAKNPARVQSMVLVAPAGLLRKSNLTAQEQAYFGSGQDEDVVRKWVVEFLEGGELVVPSDWRERVQRGEVVAEAVREWQMRMHKGHTASVVAIIRDGGVFERQAEFAQAAKSGVPSIFVLGEHDDLSSEQELRELGFENVYVVPKAGHTVVRTNVPEVAKLVGDFWKKL